MKVNYLEFLVVDFSFNWHYSFEFGQNVPPPPSPITARPPTSLLCVDVELQAMIPSFHWYLKEILLH